MTDPAATPWEAALRAAFLEGRANIFVLHGAVSDYQWAADGLTTLTGALSELLGRSRSFVVAVDGAGDGWLSASDDPAALRSAFSWARPGTRDPQAVLEAGPEVLLPALGRLLSAPAHPCGVVLAQAELLLGPEPDRATRAAVARVRRWLDAPAVRATNNAAVLIVDAISGLSPLLVGHPRLHAIEVGRPTAAQRVATLRGELGAAVVGLSDDRLAQATVGLSLVEVAALCSRLSDAPPERLAQRFPVLEPPPVDVLDVPEPPPSLASDVESPDV